MTDDTQIHRNANGSIDLERYVKIGRALHGQAIRGAIARVMSIPDRQVVGRLLRQLPRGRGRVSEQTNLSPAN